MRSKLVTTVLAAAFATALGAGTAAASDKCSAPKAEWQPQEALLQKLQGEGWKVKKIKTDDGCYEVYGTDAGGKRREAYFDPRTFTVVKSSSES
jgi:hypothetical protein